LPTETRARSCIEPGAALVNVIFAITQQSPLDGLTTVVRDGPGSTSATCCRGSRGAHGESLIFAESLH
jgi:hypothetical protein